MKKMKIGIMQPYFFPYIGYWQLINAVDKYVIYDDVNYKKSGWINRNRIIINGEVRFINLKMKGASQNKLINEIEGVNDKVNNRKLLITIEKCYKKTPYFNEVFPMLREIINYDEKNLAKKLEYSIRRICNYLSINTKIICSSNISKNNDLKAQDKIIEICKILGGSEYYNSIGGRNLYSYKNFGESGIELKFLDTDPIEYKQFNNDFINNLSIIDVMMFNSKEEIKDKLGKFKIL